MSEARKPLYVIFKSDGSGQFPTYRTIEGKVSLVLFRSREAAQAFLDGMGTAQECQVVEYSQPATVEWIREAVKRHGASEMAVDPDPATFATDAKVIPIVIFLIELEG